MMWNLIGGKTPFLGRLVVSCAVLGSAAALGSVGYSSYIQIRERELLRNEDQPILNKLNSGTTAPLATRIANQESLLLKIKDSIARTEAKRKLARLYGDLATQKISLNELPKSEVALQRAMQLDPSNSRYVAQMGALYERSATLQSEPDQKCVLYQSSAQYYRDASTLVATEQDRIANLESAINGMLNAARTLESQGLPERAISIMKRTLEWAPDQAQATKKVEAFISGQH
ncbi:MAG: hypothetical protein ABL949_04125 [Fimbriimonadaceae bacterium]